MARYRERFAVALVEIDGSGDAVSRVERFVDLFRRTLASGDRLCLCGMLASEHANLPAVVQKEVRRFFVETEAWLARVLADGRASAVLAFAGDPAELASTLFSALEGAMIAARAFGDYERLSRSGALFVALLRAPSTAIGRTKRGTRRSPALRA